MTLNASSSLAEIGTFLFIFLIYREIEGYEMMVYRTETCPRNETEWNERSTAIKCTTNRTYMCLPNKNFTELLEFCYILPQFLIAKDICLYLHQSNKRVDAYTCRSFEYGCPTSTYWSSKIFQYPNCLHIENGCFSAERACERHINTENVNKTKEDRTSTYSQETTEKTTFENGPVSVNNKLVLVGPLLGLIVPIVVLSMIFFYYNIRRKSAIAKRRIIHCEEECTQLLENTYNDRPKIIKDNGEYKNNTKDGRPSMSNV